MVFFGAWHSWPGLQRSHSDQRPVRKGTPEAIEIRIPGLAAASSGLMPARESDQTKKAGKMVSISTKQLNSGRYPDLIDMAEQRDVASLDALESI